ncbi:MAG TPA: hypothetical protein VHE81_20695 [Lacipirellulaceae bacterium]|nr:hypothetical protein [Lacipirellulaceae bacterium]
MNLLRLISGTAKRGILLMVIGFALPRPDATISGCVLVGSAVIAMGQLAIARK